MSVSSNRVELDFPEEIQALEFCPFVQGKDILIVCGQKKFYLQQLKFSKVNHNSNPNLMLCQPNIIR